MTASELMAALGPRLSNTKLIVVANREPYIHVKRTVAPRRRGVLAWFRGRGEQASLTWMRPALFASGLVTNLDASGIRRTVGDIGGQLDFRLHMLSTLDLTLSVGGAVAYERGAAPRREAMVSLKILR